MSQYLLAKKTFSRADITTETVSGALIEAGTLRGAARLLNADRSVFRRFPELISKFKDGTLQHNHKVIDVKPIQGIHDTYCLTAPSTGNFALSAGVFVSNCGIIANLTPAESQWQGHLTLEFSNSSSADCRIYANEGVVQLLFLEGEDCEVSYSDRAGKYQNQPEQVTLARV
jgi:dCTP deaminase